MKFRFIITKNCCDSLSRKCEIHFERCDGLMKPKFVAISLLSKTMQKWDHVLFQTSAHAYFQILDDSVGFAWHAADYQHIVVRNKNTAFYMRKPSGVDGWSFILGLSPINSIKCGLLLQLIWSSLGRAASRWLKGSTYGEVLLIQLTPVSVIKTELPNIRRNDTEGPRLTHILGLGKNRVTWSSC